MHLAVQDLTRLLEALASALVSRNWGEMMGGRMGENVPTVHVRNHIDFRLCLRNLLLRGDLGFCAEEHGHFGRCLGCFLLDWGVKGCAIGEFWGVTGV